MTFATIQELADALSEDSVKDLDGEDFEELLQEPLDASELDILAEAAKQNTSITSLYLTMQDKYDIDTTAFYKALAKLQKLQTFYVVASVVAEIEYCGIDFSGIAALVREYRHLHVLHIAEDNGILRLTRPWDTEVLAVAISNHPSLAEILLYNFEDSLENSENMFRAIATIKTLKAVYLTSAHHGPFFSCNHLHYIFQAPALATCELLGLEFVGDKTCCCHRSKSICRAVWTDSLL
jgi:hypothetical protein